MSSIANLSVPTLSVTETAALLDEVAASIEAEVPMPVSLTTLEGREAGKIATVAREIRQAIEAGMPIQEAVSSNLQYYQGPVANALRFGLQTGNAPRSLRTLAGLMVQRQELRLRQLIASVYPTFVVLLAYFVGVIVLGSIVKAEIDIVQWPAMVVVLSTWLLSFWWLPPLVFLSCVLLFKLLGLDQRIPMLFQPIGWSNQALFCDAIAWQLECHTPIPAAVRSAASLTDDRKLMDDAEVWAVRLEHGQAVNPESAEAGKLSAIRPLVVWTVENALKVDSGQTAAQTLDALKRLAEAYRSSEQRAWNWWTRWLPAATATLVGGGLAVCYLCVVVWPLYNKLAEVQ